MICVQTIHSLPAAVSPPGTATDRPKVRTFTGSALVGSAGGDKLVFEAMSDTSEADEEGVRCLLEVTVFAGNGEGPTIMSFEGVATAAMAADAGALSEEIDSVINSIDGDRAGAMTLGQFIPTAGSTISISTDMAGDGTGTFAIFALVFGFG